MKSSQSSLLIHIARQGLFKVTWQRDCIDPNSNTHIQVVAVIDTFPYPTMILIIDDRFYQIRQLIKIIRSSRRISFASIWHTRVPRAFHGFTLSIRTKYRASMLTYAESQLLAVEFQSLFAILSLSCAWQRHG